MILVHDAKILQGTSTTLDPKSCSTRGSRYLDQPSAITAFASAGNGLRFICLGCLGFRGPSCTHGYAGLHWDQGIVVGDHTKYTRT